MFGTLLKETIQIPPCFVKSTQRTWQRVVPFTFNNWKESLYTNYCIKTLLRSAPPLISTGDLKLTFTADKQNCGIRFLEHVQVNMDLTFPGRGHLEMNSKSPSGTKSQLLYPRFFDSFSSRKNLTNWNVTSLHYWGENPTGDWNITIRSTQRRWTRGNGNT